MIPETKSEPKFFLVTIMLLLFFSINCLVNAKTMEVVTRNILEDVTTTATSSSFEMFGAKKSFQLVGATFSGTGTAAAEIQVSNDNSNWAILDTLSITLSATEAECTNDTYTMDAPWKYTRGVLNVLTGTGATVSLTSGELSRF